MGALSLLAFLNLGVIADGNPQSVWFMLSLLCDLILVLSLQKTLLLKDRLLEMEEGFSVLLWQPQGIPP